MTDSTNRLPLAFLAPRYWPVWLGLGLLWSATRLPYPVQWRLGTALGRLMYVLMPRRRHVAAVNLRLCFPELDEDERLRLLRGHFQSLGMMVVEIGLSWWSGREDLGRLATVEGLEYLQHALAQGRGVLLLSAHFTTMEIGGHILAARMGAHLHAVYRRYDNPLVDYIAVRQRRHCIARMLPHDDVRAILRSLKENAPVWYTPDQAYRGKYSALVPFFGVPAPTHTATSRLVKVSGAPVVPFCALREPDGLRYRLIIQPPLDNFPGADPEQDAARINALIEAQVRLAPEQYYWVHRRFKRRGEDVYRTG